MTSTPKGSAMPDHANSRFDAELVVRLATVTDPMRFEMQLKDAAGANHVISMPVPEVVALARLICDAYESAPYTLSSNPAPTHFPKRSP
jgi:hypothetical protein